MAKINATVRFLVQAAVAGIATTALCTTATWAKVGVTSATDGDPLGKPPTENERVLRIGIDIQADEVVTTNNSDRAHLVFLDGTSLTVGPNARVVIDKFVYDSKTKTGQLAVTASKGVFRLVGGRISKTNAITVTTPSSTIGIRGGITIFSADALQTIANFIFGNSMSVTGAGQTQIATRPGSQIIANFGLPPGLPTLLPPGALQNAMSQLETGKSDSSGNNQGTGGLASTNSGQSFVPPPTNPISTSNQQQITNAVSGATDQTQPQNDATRPSAPPSPPSQQTQTLTGYAAGLIVTERGESVKVRPPVLGGSPNLSITTDSTNYTASGTITVGGKHAVTTLQLGGTPTSSVFLGGQDYVMLTTDDPTRKSTVQVHNKTFNVQDTTILVGGGAFGSSGGSTLAASSTPCACDYLHWGYWASAITYPNGRTDIVPAGLFVAGTITPAVQLPQTGSATYSGVMAGSVQNGNSGYLAFGNYSSTWGFASRTGTFNASFDNTSYSGTMSATPASGGVSFTGNFSGSGRTGALNGSFFSGPGDATKYQGGAFTIGNGHTPYKASGVFAGQKTGP